MLDWILEKFDIPWTATQATFSLLIPEAITRLILGDLLQIKRASREDAVQVAIDSTAYGEVFFPDVYNFEGDFDQRPVDIATEFAEGVTEKTRFKREEGRLVGSPLKWVRLPDSGPWALTGSRTELVAEIVRAHHVLGLEPEGSTSSNANVEAEPTTFDEVLAAVAREMDDYYN